MFIIIGLILCIIGGVLCYRANQKRVQKSKEQEQYKQKLESEIKNLQSDFNQLHVKYLTEKENIQSLKSLKITNQEELNQYIQFQKQQAKEVVDLAWEESNEEIAAISNHILSVKNQAQKEEEELKEDLNKIKASISAGVEARLRDQQKKDKINFYKLSIKNTDLKDVKMLENLKASLHNPVILSKLIWTQFFQKQTNELCDRVLGKKTVCGIYKITNLLTEQCYIGQSVDIAKRWKDHCKCGLGIDASATNKLYNSMQQDGIWNFSFELLEQCPRNLLNEKEKFWIQMYQSNKFGLNITKGNL